MNKRMIVATLLGMTLVAGLIVATGLPGRFSLAQDGGFTYSGDTPAPEFPDGLQWLNVTEPLTMDELQGKIVLLDFWTYGCINCIHIIPDLRRLEAEFGDHLVVIGVHSAKFENEGQTENIRQIVQRYDVVHPVVNDNEFAVWQTYGVQAWPTLVLIDPEGNVVGGHSGEGIYPLFQPILQIMVDEFGDAGLLDDTPLSNLSPEIEQSDPGALSYPGKVLADPATNRLIISDTAHHRIIVTALDNYDDFTVIGSGERGFEDGTFELAQFNNPQGLALAGDILYVADTDNHAIRTIDLANGTVETLTGTGNQAAGYPPLAGNAPFTPLSSPWDLVLYDNFLYIAMAGPHQLWRINLDTGRTEPYAGSGRENIIDGPLAQAQLAQPSGIDTDGTLLYFADSESSSIRTASLDSAGEVGTIVGTGLFDFGDVDGVGDEVRLQHALGVAVGPDGLLYVTDTYNNKIKLIDPATRESRTFAGDGTPGLVDGTLAEARFYEPGGIDYADGKLYIADTNNDAIRIIDLASGMVSTVTFTDPAVLVPATSTRPENPLSNVNINTVDIGDKVVELEEQSVAPGKGALVLEVNLPEGYKLNDQAPFTVISEANDTVSLTANFLEYYEVLPELPLRLPVTFNAGSTLFTTELTIYWCEGINQTLCFVEDVTLRVPVTVSAEAGSTELTLPYDLVPPNFDSD